MGSDDFHVEERPTHQVMVDGFWLDEHPVTNEEFRRFVKATGYVTLAERPISTNNLKGRKTASEREIKQRHDSNRAGSLIGTP